MPLSVTRNWNSMGLSTFGVYLQGHEEVPVTKWCQKAEFFEALPWDYRHEVDRKDGLSYQKLKMLHCSRGRVLWPGTAREWKGRRATFSDLSRFKNLLPHTRTLTSFKTWLQPAHTLPVTKKWSSHWGHPSRSKTHHVNLGMYFTYLYFLALSDVCPTFLLLHCKQMCVLTLPTSLREQFSERGDAAQVAQGL